MLVNCRYNMYRKLVIWTDHLLHVCRELDLNLRDGHTENIVVVLEDGVVHFDDESRGIC
jgi:hypothetical protein